MLVSVGAFVVVIVVGVNCLVRSVRERILLYELRGDGKEWMPYVEEIRILRRLTDLDPANDDYRYLLAMYLGLEAMERQKAGDKSRAWLLLDEALGTDVGNCSVYCSCVRAHLEEKHWFLADFFASRCAVWARENEASRSVWRRSGASHAPGINMKLAEAALRDGEYAITVRAFFRRERLVVKPEAELNSLNAEQWVDKLQSSLAVELTEQGRISLLKCVEGYISSSNAGNADDT